MRVAVLSDIHANRPALDAVLDDIPTTCDEILFCGDLVGYYPWPNAVTDLAADHNVQGVRGNHDEAIIQDSTFGFSGAAGQALHWTEAHLNDHTRDYLQELPYTRREEHGGQDILIAHGSPQAPTEEYVYPEQVDEHFLSRQNAFPDILLLGHTHVPFTKTVDNTLVVNPGSVGQPRDGNPDAAYAVLDLDEPRAEIHRVQYDIDKVADAVTDADLPSMLAERLYRGQ